MKHCHKLFRTVALIGAGIIATGCERVATGPVQASSAQAEGAARQVAVTNRSGRPVFTATFGRNASAIVNWAACVEGPGCDPLAPGATRRESIAMHGGTPETEAIVYWWHAVRGADGGVQADSIRYLVVRL